MSSRLEPHLVRLRQNDPTLTELRLTSHDLTDEDAKALAEALEGTTSLTHLYLNKNSIGIEGAKAIAKAIASNTTLTHLFLGYNRCGDEGVKAIAKALESNNTLTFLELSWNRTGFAAAKAMAQSLKSNRGLKRLDFINFMGDQGIRLFSEALEENIVLTELALNGNVPERAQRCLDQNRSKEQASDSR